MSEYNAEQLLKRINELEAELKTIKKYGLVWDKENTREDVVLECEKNIPVLVQDKQKKLLLGNENNVIIEGDNFHALSSLSFIAKESVDVIYIDPPYNTGHEDFVYNDKYVNDEDGFIHSKWLSFMSKRLNFAKELLKKSGSIFISIDDHEQANLKILCDSIFGESNYIGCFVVNAAPNGRDYGAMAKQHEYCLFYAKSISDMKYYMIEDKEKKFTYKDSKGGFNIHPLYNSNVAFTPENRPNLYYPFYVNPSKKQSATFYEISLEAKDGWVEVYPPKSVKDNVQFVWRWGRLKSEQFLNEEIIGHKVGDEFRIVEKMRHSHKIIRSLLVDSNFATRKGTAELENILGEKRFSYPKPVELLRQLLMATTDKDSLVLDFFAGSGTTGQATLELNKLDGGNRRFILCTNNENNICSDVTYTRLKTIITGIRPNGSKYSDGIPANLYYFKTDFIEDQPNTEQARYNLVEKVDALLCISEDIMEEVERNNYSSHYVNDNKHLFIYNDYYNQTKFNEFKQRVLSTIGEKIVYVYASDNNIDETLIEGNDIDLKPIPSKIYEIYKEIVEDIKRGE